MGSLALVDLKKRFGAVETLKGVSLSLEKGEFLVLLGPSGCGKSTILNIIAGLLEPSSGDVRIGDHSVLGVHPKNRDIAMVFQSYALYPNLSVARNIGFGLEMRGVSKPQREAKVQAVAETLQVTHLLGRKPGELSGGQRQRVAIGRALVRDPAVFLFDEPLSNLDAKLRMEMRTELKRLHQTLGTTIVYVTHDQIEAMTLATKVAVMRDGRVEQLGTPDEIYRRPASLFVAGFVGSPGMNLIRGNIEDGMFRLMHSDAKLALPPQYAQHGKDHGRALVLGIRPENLKLATPSDQAAVTALVDVVELTGPAKLVLARIGSQSVLASIAPESLVRHATTQRFSFDLPTAMLFDPATERALET
jgi:multiple sugar transport system ATP-binding protein